MLLAFMKTDPTRYALVYSGSRLIREGAGLGFWYFKPTTTIMLVPLVSVDVPFVFEVPSADYQQVTVQGQLTYRVADAKKLAAMLDYTVDGRQNYNSDDPGKLADRLSAKLQVLARGFILQRHLRDALVASDALAVHMLPPLRQDKGLELLGLEMLSLSILAIRPTPQVGEALEAEAREALLRQADQAVYDRRNAAVEQERRIRESELSTEIAVEQKKRQVRETQTQADIVIEEQRAKLVEQAARNQRVQADAAAYALDAQLGPIRNMDWRLLLAARGGGLGSEQLIAMAFRDLADNAGKIGELNISPDLLGALMKPNQTNNTQR